MDKYVGQRFKTKEYGELIVLAKDTKCGKRQKYIVKFLETGTIKDFVARSAIVEGSVKDPYYPHILGIACIGNAKTTGNLYLYQTWQNMIRRCYDTKRHNYSSYGGRGYIVDKRWLCFENFLKDVPTLPGYDLDLILQGKLVLDKDGLAANKDCKIYSPTTTRWVTPEENANLRDTSTYTIKYDIYNCIGELEAHNVTIQEAAVITGYKVRTLQAHVYQVKPLKRGYNLLRISQGVTTIPQGSSSKVKVRRAKRTVRRTRNEIV